MNIQAQFAATSWLPYSARLASLPSRAPRPLKRCPAEPAQVQDTLRSDVSAADQVRARRSNMEDDYNWYVCGPDEAAQRAGEHGLQCRRAGR